MRALLAIALMAGPAMAASAQDALPTRMTCTLVEICVDDDTCRPFPSGPDFTLMFDGQDWLWDPAADWGGFPVLLAREEGAALARHLADPSLGLALIPAAAEAADGAVTLDAIRLGRPPEPALSNQWMRNHCRAAAAS